MRFNFPLFALCFSTTLTWAEDVDPKGTNSKWSSELMMRMHEHGTHQPEIFSQALKVIEGLQSSPSCIRLAVSTLVDSCQSLDQNGGDSVSPQTDEFALDGIKSEFAARLAMCELAGATRALPRECAALTPTTGACPRSRFSRLFSRKQEDAMDKICYSAAGEAEIKDCLSAMETRPQWWTSYSNARQNAMVICQASRDLIEKDKTIGIYKALTEQMGALTSQMNRAVMEQALALEGSKEYAELLSTLQKDAVRAFENGNRDAQRVLARFMAEMQTAVSIEIEKYIQALGKTESEVDSLTQAVMQSSSQVLASHEEVGRAISVNMLQFAEGITEQNQLFEHSQGLGLAMVKAFEDARRIQLEDLGATSTSLRNVRAEMDSVDRNFVGISHSLVAVHEDIAELVSTVSNLHQTTEQMKTTLQEARSIINRVAGLVSVIKYWRFLLFFVIFIFIALSAIGKLRSAIIAIAASCFLIITYFKLFSRQVAEAPETVSAHDISLPSAIPRGITIGVIFVLALIVALLLARRNALCRYGDFLIPRIEVPNFFVEKIPPPNDTRRWDF